jgi:ABC-type branched-subunit amino acid transport system substrate-binding protein
MDQINTILRPLTAPRQLVALFMVVTTMAAQAGEVVVAQVAPFTGGIAVYSNEIKVCATALFDAVNAAGGLYAV